jgi:ankyrin repeat protein
MSEQRNYMAEVQALIDQKWKENPEEMKRVMEEIKAKEKKEKNAKVETPKVKPSKQVSFDPQLTQELIKELYKPFDRVDISKIQDLIERGADVNAKKNDEWTPLLLASSWSCIELAKFVLDAGADMEAKNKYGVTPLHMASGGNCIELVKLLLDRGADVRAKDRDGQTPLHSTSHWDNHIEIAEILIKAGADVEAKNKWGETPLYVASRFDRKETVKFLQKYMK